MQGNRCALGIGDVGDDGVKAAGLGHRDDLFEERFADPETTSSSVDIDTVLNGGVVRRPVSVRRQRREADDSPIDLGDEDSERALTFTDPGPLLVDGARYEVER